jgi:hypothetical protein
MEVWDRIPLSRRSVSNSLLGKKQNIFQIIPDYIRPGLTLDQSGTSIIRNIHEAQHANSTHNTTKQHTKQGETKQQKQTNNRT